MSPALIAQPQAPPPRIARITVDQYHRMIKTGILREGDPIELLDGMLVYKDRSARGKNPMGIGELHNVVVSLLGRLTARLEALGCYMQIQGPISLPPHHEPEPDGAIVKGVPRDYTTRLPGPDDVCCVIEVADSSLAHDRTTKLRIYAQAGIPQYVVINLVDSQIELYEQPVPAEGRYANAAVVKAGETLALRTSDAGTLQLPAAQVLP
ncbi:MAG: Uma2 family endonuclease [Planctomycetota bacterium]|nr:Uma2 family endonuclease [Planctomycetota bacterium]